MEEANPWIGWRDLAVNPGGYDLKYFDQPGQPCDHVKFWPKSAPARVATADRRTHRMIGARTVYDALVAAYDPTIMPAAAHLPFIPLLDSGLPDVQYVNILPPPLRTLNITKTAAAKRLGVQLIDMEPIAGHAAVHVVTVPPTNSLSSPVAWSNCCTAAIAYYILHYSKLGYLYWSCREIEMAAVLARAIRDDQQEVANAVSAQMVQAVPYHDLSATRILAHYKCGSPIQNAAASWPGIVVYNLADTVDACSHAVFAQLSGLQLPDCIPHHRWMPEDTLFAHPGLTEFVATFARNQYPFLGFGVRLSAESLFADVIETARTATLYVVPNSRKARAVPFAQISRTTAQFQAIKFDPYSLVNTDVALPPRPVTNPVVNAAPGATGPAAPI